MIGGKLFVRFLLTAILLWAALLRLWRCETAPAGLYVDEASNAWNARCLLKTGRDESGTSWPIFYTRAFDDFRSPLYLYLILPFQAIGGMNVCTTRLPAALSGVVTVALMFYIGRRLFDDIVGLCAAAMVAISPWHLQHTRWGHEGSLMPLLVALPIAALLWAGIPPLDATSSHPRRWKVLAAGIVVGMAFYGYAAIRMYLPIALIAAGLVLIPQWRVFLRQRASRQMAMLFLVGLGILVAPLIWKHLTDPYINLRALELRPWATGDGVLERIFKIADRYPAHFSIPLLFESGDPNPALASPAGFGCLNWFMLPLLLIGMGTLAARALTSLPARLLLVLLVTYPAGDLLFGTASDPHVLRSFPGILWLSLTAAFGASVLVRWAAQYARSAALAAAAVLLVWGGWNHAQFLRAFFGPFNEDRNAIWVRNIDLQQACEWLKPRLDDLDAVFISEEGLTFPYAPTLVFVNHDPHQWFSQPREYAPGRPPFQNRQICDRFGKIRFIRDVEQTRTAIQTLKSHRIAMILRPDQAQLAGDHAKVGEIQIAGQTRFVLYEFAP